MIPMSPTSAAQPMSWLCFRIKYRLAAIQFLIFAVVPLRRYNNNSNNTMRICVYAMFLVAVCRNTKLSPQTIRGSPMCIRVSAIGYIRVMCGIVIVVDVDWRCNTTQPSPQGASPRWQKRPIHRSRSFQSRIWRGSFVRMKFSTTNDDDLTFDKWQLPINAHIPVQRIDSSASDTRPTCEMCIHIRRGRRSCRRERITLCV